MAGTTSCPNCSGEYSHIGKHWSGSKCYYPDLSDRQRQIIIGTLLGDGSIPKSVGSHKPRFLLEVCEKEFIDWVAGELDYFVSNVSKRVPENNEWRDQYKLQTVSHPTFDSIRERWYPDGHKSFPDTIDISPTVLSMWYVTDGGISEDKRCDSRRAYISAWNERESKEKVLSYFDETPFDPYWSGEKQFYIPADQTNKFLDWIEGPVPGYEYKWTERFK